MGFGVPKCMVETLSSEVTSARAAWALGTRRIMVRMSTGGGRGYWTEAGLCGLPVGIGLWESACVWRLSFLCVAQPPHTGRTTATHRVVTVCDASGVLPRLRHEEGHRGRTTRKDTEKGRDYIVRPRPSRSDRAARETTDAPCVEMRRRVWLVRREGVGV